MSVVPVLSRLRQKVHFLKVKLGYTPKLCEKNQRTTNIIFRLIPCKN